MDKRKSMTQKQKKIIEPIKPIFSKIPKEWKIKSKKFPIVEVIEWLKYQTGWDYGEDGDLIGKINRIIEWINNHEDLTN